MLVLIKGAGDLATGTALRLHRCHIPVCMTELPVPSAIRRSVCFSEAIRLGQCTVEDVTAKRADDPAHALSLLKEGFLPVLADPELLCRPALNPFAVVDATLAKRNLGLHITDAPVVIALGPGFTAGVDCHAVVETMRGHDLGRVLYDGQALPNTGVPGKVGGESHRRILRAPADGPFVPLCSIGDSVRAGDTVATVAGVPMNAELTGVLRGLLPAGYPAVQGMKSGDIDPRCRRENCFSVSDKSHAVAGGVLEALLHLGGPFSWKK